MAFLLLLSFLICCFSPALLNFMQAKYKITQISCRGVCAPFLTFTLSDFKMFILKHIFHLFLLYICEATKIIFITILYISNSGLPLQIKLKFSCLQSPTCPERVMTFDQVLILKKN